MIRAAFVALVVATIAPTLAVAQDDELVGNPPAEIDPFQAPTEVPPTPEEVPAPPEPSPAQAMLEDPAAAAAAERAERLSKGRTNLLLGQMAHGAALGVELAFLFTPFGEEVPNAAVIAGAGAGFLAGFLIPYTLFPEGLEPGRAAAINSGPFWGFWLAHTAGRTNYGIRKRGTVGVAILGQLAGLGAGELAWRLWEPTRGQVTLVDSVAFWTTTLATLGLVVEANWDFPQERPIVAGAHFWGATIGLVGGGFLAAANPGVRGDRVMFINMGGIVGGALAPFGVAIAAGGIDSSTAALVAIAGAGAGMGLTAFFTRYMKPRQTRTPTVSFQLAPTADGGATVGLGGLF